MNKAPWFIKLAHVNWNRVSIVVSATAIFWSGLAAIVPAKHHTVVMVVLSSVQSGFVFLLRANKYVTERGEVPRVGEVP